MKKENLASLKLQQKMIVLVQFQNVNFQSKFTLPQKIMYENKCQWPNIQALQIKYNINILHRITMKQLIQFWIRVL